MIKKDNGYIIFNRVSDHDTMTHIAIAYAGVVMKNKEEITFSELADRIAKAWSVDNPTNKHFVNFLRGQDNEL